MDLLSGGSHAARAVRAEAGVVMAALRRARRGPGRERDLLVQSLKAAGAAILAWSISGWWLKDPVALMAPWVAVVLVQATVYRSVLKGLQQLAAIAAGTLVAAAAVAVTGDTLAAIAVALPVVMLLSNWPRFGDQGIYGPTTALFTLTSTPVSDVTVTHRLLQAALGAAIGIAVNALILPPVHLRDVRENLRALAEEAAETLRAIGEGLVEERWDVGTAADWTRRSEDLRQRLDSLRAARRWSGESLRLNPGRRRRLRRWTTDVPSGEEDERWARIVAHLSALVRTLADIADENRAIEPPDARALCDHGRLLGRLADACRAHATLLSGPAAPEAAAARSDLEEALAQVAGLHTSLQENLVEGGGRGGTPSIAAFGALLVQAQNIWHEACLDDDGTAPTGRRP
ncbi:aromatic acid exporter family protein [Streptomyces sparsogenes]|uniref:FUSC family protein n=1 Tax=Streptomyces sparsogenes TaxID=67365 RepID=UPI0033D90EC5